MRVLVACEYSCNKALGLLEDNTEWLRKAEDYLARNND